MPPDPLDRAPVQTVDQAVQLMADLESTLSDQDGLKWFDHLYLSVTRAVQQQLAGGGAWNDPAFLAHLDVVFANLYFAAASAAEMGPRRLRRRGGRYSRHAATGGSPASSSRWPA